MDMLELKQVGIDYGLQEEVLPKLHIPACWIIW